MKKHLLIFILILVASIATYFYFSQSKIPETNWTRENSLKKVPCIFSTLKADPALLKASLINSIEGLKKSKTPLQFGTESYDRELVQQSFEKFKSFLTSNPSPDVIKIFINNNFTCYQSAAEQVLFTGYYIPTLQGSFVKTDRFRYPLYKKPKDLITISLSDDIEKLLPREFPVLNRGRFANEMVYVPYYSRKEIDYENKFQDKNMELLWVDDDVDLFFLHIQGSGLVELPDGKKVYVGYADKNGNPYKPIGKALIERGLLTKETATMYGIKAKLREQPEIKKEILSYNPSYVFFRVLDSKPVGSFGVELTGGYSIATDTKIFPQGALAVINMEKYFQLALNQDTGGAIRGPGRVDFFFGEGKTAEEQASGHKNSGSLFFLAPK